MDNRNNKRAAKFLRELAKDGPNDPDDRYGGICFNLSLRMRSHRVEYLTVDGLKFYSAYHFVERAARGWKHHSGVAAFPVPGEYKGDNWAGETGALRRDLCLYLADRLEQEP